MSRERRSIRIGKRDNWECRYCGTPLTQETIQLDHIHPKSKGGRNEDSNRCASCARCNTFKANLSLDEFKEKVAIRELEAHEMARYWSSVLERFPESEDSE